MSPPVAEATHRSQPVGLTGGEAGTGFKQRILAYCLDHGMEMSGAKARRLGERMYRRALVMQEEFDFDRELRVLGIHRDPTAADAIYNIKD